MPPQVSQPKPTGTEILEPGTIQFLQAVENRDRQEQKTAVHLLVVDDDRRHRESLRDILTLSGYECRTAACGTEAIAILEKEQVDLMLLDLRMPGMNGHELMDCVKTRGLDIAVIVISGEPSWDAATRSLRRGADDFIRKPYAADEVLTAIDNSLQKRQLKRINEQMVQQQQVSERLHRFIVNRSPDFIYMLDKNGRFQFLNDKVVSLLGYSKNELIDQHFSVLLQDPSVADAFVFNDRRSDERPAANIEIELKKRADGVESGTKRTVTVELTAMGIYYRDAANGQKTFLGTYGVARDISERKKAEAVINYQAYHDLLTGLPNRALFNDRLGLAIRQARRDSGNLAIMFVDLDRFKLVNDTLGHAQGDLLLQAVATRIENCIRRGDTLSRIGGDEFTLLLPQIKTPLDASTIAGKILEALRDPFLIGNQELFVRASIGIALFPEHGNDSAQLIKRADMAMYEVKGSGRDSFGYYSRQLDAKYIHKLSIESGMRKAVEGNQFFIKYQPQVRICDRSLSSMEALIRWNHPRRGLLEPADFIPDAEENGLIVGIGQWVLEQVLTDLRHWKEQGLNPRRVAVNISALQLEHPDFVDNLMDLLEKHQVPGFCLELEITENVIMKDIKGMVRRLKKLSDAGVKIAIDDFGTGYSSLSYLQTLPINTLKMDQSFVSGIERGAQDDSIVTAIVAMAKGLKLSLVAEGVEKEDQALYLERIGCEQAQGYLFSTPLEFNAATRYLRRNVRSD